jgi:hypothetical protein
MTVGFLRLELTWGSRSALLLGGSMEIVVAFLGGEVFEFLVSTIGTVFPRRRRYTGAELLYVGV